MRAILILPLLFLITTARGLIASQLVNRKHDVTIITTLASKDDGRTTTLDPEDVVITTTMPPDDEPTLKAKAFLTDFVRSLKSRSWDDISDFFSPNCEYFECGYKQSRGWALGMLSSLPPGANVTSELVSAYGLDHAIGFTADFVMTYKDKPQDSIRCFFEYVYLEFGIALFYQIQGC